MVILHAWSKGLDRKKYQVLINLLSERYRIISFDFPGFGGSSFPPRPWTVDDYTDFTASFLDKLKIGVCLLLGHSFGGRVAIKLASRYPERVAGLILVDSAGIERKSFKVKTVIAISERIPLFLKRFFRPVIGSKDFREAGGVMRETLKLVVAEDLEEEIKSIKKKTLIVWGEEDRTTPLWQGRLIHRLIKGSELVVISNANHGLPWKNPKELAKKIFNF